MDEVLEPICFECVGDSFLQQSIISSGAKGACLNCGKNQLSIELDTLANQVGRILSVTVDIGDYHDVWDHERDRISHTEQQGDPLNFFVLEILRLDDEEDPVIDLVLDRLMSHSPGEEGFFDHDNYTRKTIIPFEVELNWIQFQSELMHTRRFFNEKAKKFLEWLFDGIDSYYAWGFDRGVVRTLSPAECEPIYRARDCTPPKDQSQTIITDPKKQLAAPPKELAPTGRMSPAGVPVFYSAFERETCIAELRPGA